MSAEIRVLTTTEVQHLLDWAADEGWNPGIGDAEAFHAVDPDGFLGCFIGGEMAAGIAAVAYDDHFGFIGLYICHPAYRGKGFGRMVWDAGMAHLGTRVIGLDGVPEQQENYRRMGFEAAYRTIRYSGPSARLAESAGKASNRSVRPYDSSWHDAVMQIDRACFPAERTTFMAGWLQPPRHAVVAEREGTFSGFAAARPCQVGWKIGPVMAKDSESAVALVRDLARTIDGTLSIDVPENQGSLVSLLLDAGFVSDFATARMYRGGAPKISGPHLYATTTLELG
jgi:GNAT superfamily N-acetyltransferase